MNTDILGEMTLAVVNSNEHLSLILREVTSALGIGRTMRLPTADKAWSAMYASEPPDVALVEIELEDGSGLDFVRRVRTDPTSPNRYLPIIVVTGRAERRWVMASIDAGAHEFVALPISARKLYPRLWSAAIVGRPFVTSGQYFGPCRRRYDDPQYNGPERRSNDHRRAADDLIKDLKTKRMAS